MTISRNQNQKENMVVFVINVVQYLFLKEACIPRCPNPSPSQCTVRCPNSSCQNIMTLALCKEFKTSEDKNEFKYKYDE